MLEYACQTAQDTMIPDPPGRSPVFVVQNRVPRCSPGLLIRPPAPLWRRESWEIIREATGGGSVLSNRPTILVACFLSALLCPCCPIASPVAEPAGPQPRARQRARHCQRPKAVVDTACWRLKLCLVVLQLLLVEV